ncbi:MAG: IS1634 family transposase [Bacillota bacterium]
MLFWLPPLSTGGGLPGFRVQSPINAAGRKPLYKVEEFYAEQDVEKVLGEGVRAEDINDDALGRTLDRMAQVDLKGLFSSVSLSCVLKDDIEVKSVHADTTSISVYGEYEDDSAIIEINHGHSKDKRPDLQQFVCGLLVNTEGIPLAGDVLSGNTSDKTWNGKVITELEALFRKHGKDIVCVADSALVGKENLELMAQEGIRFISRVPGTFGVEEAIKDIAWEKDDWVEMGTFSERYNAAAYRAQSFEQEINGRRYRFIAVGSTSLDRQKEKTLTKRLAAERLEIEKAARELGKKGFYCQADAEQAAVEFQKEHGGHFSMGFQVKPEVTIIRGRGRPRKGIEPVTETHYRVVLSVGTARQEVVQRTHERLSTFVLITNVPREEMNDREVLSEYKSQGRTVETKFRFLKTPRMWTASI